MVRKFRLLIIFSFLFGIAQHCFAQNERLGYHAIKTDNAGKIIPWYSAETGKAYSNAIQSVWHFWDTMRTDLNGIPYYMNHQVWRPGINDPRGIAGSQFSMAMESWRLLYAYNGDERLKDNIKFMADYTIANGFSSAASQWPNLPYPYNTLLYSGKYDGDMVLGKNYLQPDKAGSFGMELVQLYKLIGNNSYQDVVGNQYLEIAVGIANTLAEKMIDGDADNSPLPFKVNTVTGQTGHIYLEEGGVGLSSYTSNWSGTMELYLELIKLNKGNIGLYQKAFDRILVWMKMYPLRNNKWGPFFEDISVWSDTQINAITFAQFMMNHPSYFPAWKQQVKGIFEWVYSKMKNDNWKKYGVTVINEQTAYQVPGNSHTARQAAAELQYVSLTGDTSFRENAIRQLNWATYMVNTDGKNRYPQDDIWLTDGYGDYVRHYLLAMAALPSLAVCNQEHILSSSSVIQQADYKDNLLKGFEPAFIKPVAVQASLFYRTYDAAGRELIFLLKKPVKVLLNKTVALEVQESTSQGFQWKKAAKGGFLIIQRMNVKEVTIM